MIEIKSYDKQQNNIQNKIAKIFANELLIYINKNN